MKAKYISIMSALLLSTVPMVSFSGTPGEAPAEPGLELSASVAVTNNYLWRGISQTENHMAFQGEFKASYMGFYVGSWGSSVKFSYPVASGAAITFAGAPGGSMWTDAYVETDGFIGYEHEFDNGLGFDVGVIQYWYPTAQYLDFTEGYVSLAWKWVSVGAAYSDHAIAMAGSGTYYNADVEIPVLEDRVENLSVSGHVGTYQFSRTSKAANGARNYTDYNVGVSKGFAEHFTLSAMVSSTNQNWFNNNLDKTLGVVTLSAEIA